MNISYVSTSTQHLDSPLSNSIKYVFLYLSRCSVVITMVMFLEGRGKLMARGMDFRKPVLREHTAPSSLCLCQYRPKVSHYFSHSSGKSLAAFSLHENFLLKASHCIRYVQRTLNNVKSRVATFAICSNACKRIF